MAIYNVHAGHCPQGKGAYGACGILKESVENRFVKNALIAKLKAAGHTVYDCTDDSNCSSSQNLKNIVAKCNVHSVDLDISIHLNAGGGTGVETLIYNDKTKNIATRISQEVSNALGIRNRGVKTRTDLYVLRHTKAPALLVECCFVDSQNDADRWSVEKCAEAIFKGITGQSGAGNVQSTPKPDKTALTVDGIWGKNTTKRLQQIFHTGSDGIISNQLSCYQQNCKGIVGTIEWSNEKHGGSLLVKALQNHVGVSADGYFGPGTIKAIQRWLGSGADGIFEYPSPAIRKLQEWCNKQ